MYSIKLSGVGAVAILATVGAHYLLGEELQDTAPAAVNAAFALPQFHPLTQADVQDALAKVKTAATAVDERFSTAGTSSDEWKKYLDWQQFEAELAKSKPDNTVLADVYKKLAAGYEGLELKWFADLRAALASYFLVDAGVGNADLEKAFKTQIDELGQEIKSLGPSPTAAETRKIGNHLLWLESARQAPELVREIRSRFSRPNLHIQVGGELIGASIGGPIDDVAPISDCILGTAIQGMGHTIGQTTTSLSPNPAFATFDAISDAMNYSNNVGRNQQVCIYSTGQTWLGADKRLWLDEDGLHAHPASAAAQAHTTITNIVADSGSRLVERIAWRRAEDQLGEAQAIASQHAAARMGDRVNNQADLSIQKANELYRKFREPLDERQVFPHDLTFDTLPSALEIHGVEARPSQLASPSVPPELTEPADVSFRIHQSMINNVAEIVLTGMRLDDTMVRHFATDMLGRLPEQLQPDQEPFTVVFPQEAVPRVEPITVSFADNGLTVTLRGQEYIANGRVQPGMDVTATYKFEKTPEGYKAVRQGDLQIYGFGQVPGAKRSARQEGIYTVLQRKFGKLFAPEIKLQGFQFKSGRLASAGKLVPREIIAQNGWLAIGYSRAQ